MLHGMMCSLRDKHGIDPYKYVAFVVKSAMEESIFPKQPEMGVSAQMDFADLMRFSRNLRSTYRYEKYREHFKKQPAYIGIMNYLTWLRNNRHKW